MTTLELLLDYYEIESLKKSMYELRSDMAKASELADERIRLLDKLLNLINTGDED